MDRIPIEEHTHFHDLIVGVYNLVFEDELPSTDLDLYDIESEYVEAEIDFPSLGINRRKWADWSPERRLEVLLHEFAHIEEGADDLDHDPSFYERLTELTDAAEVHQSEIEALFEAPIDFEAVHRHIVDSVNEHTIESDIDTVADRRCLVREQLASSSETAENDD